MPYASNTLTLLDITGMFPSGIFHPRGIYMRASQPQGRFQPAVILNTPSSHSEYNWTPVTC